MSQFKNNPDYTVFYSDTDSLIVDKYLPEDVVDNKKLGLYKLEDEYLLFIALGPKVYGALNKNGKSYTKIKGFKDKISLEALESLLNENNSLDLNQLKWFKSLSKGNITLQISPYDLKPNSNKRLLVYKNNILVDTKNIVFNDK